MLQSRVIPCLLLNNGSLVKTVQFGKYSYIGDPLNTCRIFNELEVDEMSIIDISAAKNRGEPNYNLLQGLANECFMPLSYGGGISNVEQAKKIFFMGFEKIIINSSLYTDISILEKIANIFGSQSVIAGVDVNKNIFGKYMLYSNGGKKKEKNDLIEWTKKLQDNGAGEILLTNISLEGTWKGFDINLIQQVTRNVNIPVIIHGGAGCKKDVEEAVNLGKASAVSLGSMVEYQNTDMGVLINYSREYDFGCRSK